jgi:hypothetical protein
MCSDLIDIESDSKPGTPDHLLKNLAPFGFVGNRDFNANVKSRNDGRIDAIDLKRFGEDENGGVLTS